MCLFVLVFIFIGINAISLHLQLFTNLHHTIKDQKVKHVKTNSLNLFFFILQTIVSWIGSQANIFEKQKVREIASLIRDTDRHGKAQITNVNEGEETQEMLKVTSVQLSLASLSPFLASCWYILLISRVTCHVSLFMCLLRYQEETTNIVNSWCGHL